MADNSKPSGETPKLRPAPKARQTAVGVALRERLSLTGFIKVSNTLPPKEDDVGLQPSMVAPTVEARRSQHERDRRIQKGALIFGGVGAVVVIIFSLMLLFR